MATITGFTAERMLVIESASIVDGNVVGDNLILSRFDTTTIDAGSVRGPMGPSGDIPVGSIIDYIGTTAPENYLTMVGQTIVDGETLHPLLWPVLPATMKSGSNIIMPNTKKCVSVGYDASDTDFNVIGKTGGSKTHTLLVGETPVKSHSHTVNAHSHTVNNHNHGAATGLHDIIHAHVVDPGSQTFNVSNEQHYHTFNVNSGGESAGHAHNGGMDYHFVTQTAGGSQAFDLIPGPNIIANQNNTASNSNGHTHNVSGTTSNGGVAMSVAVDIAAFWSQNGTNNHNHTISAEAPGTSNSSPATTATADTTATPHNNLQPYVTFLKIIRAA